MVNRPIMIDLDGVLCRFCDSFTNLLRSMYPGRIPDGYIPHLWSYADSGLSRDELNVAWESVGGQENFWLNLRPYALNCEALYSFLIRYPHYSVYYITSRTPTEGMPTLAQSRMWLRRESLDAPQTSVCVVEHPSQKIPLCRVLGIQYLLDDKLDTIHSFMDTKADFRPYLLHREWNTDGRRGDEKIVGSVEEFLQEVVRVPQTP